MAQVTLKIKIDLPGLQAELDKAVKDIVKKLEPLGIIDMKVDTGEAKADLKGVDDQTKKVTASAERTRTVFAEWGMIISGFHAAMAEVQNVMNIISKPIDVAAEFEQLNVQFSVLLRDGDKAKKLLQDITTLSANTPMQLLDLVKNAKTLLSFGIPDAEIIPTLKMIGDISGGDAERMQSLILAFSQMRSTGRLMGQDLLQMINAGFNPLQTISEQTGKSIGQLKKEMEGGSISADMVTKAFRDATSEGGQFNGMMEKQSQTFDGMKSNLEDASNLLLKDLGEKALGQAKAFLKTTIDMVTYLRNNMDDLISTTEETIVVIGSYVIATKGAAIATQLYTKAVDMAIIAQKALNLVMKLNPYALAAAAIALVVSEAVKYSHKIGESSDYIKDKLEQQKKTVSDLKIEWENLTNEQLKNTLVQKYIELAEANRRLAESRQILANQEHPEFDTKREQQIQDEELNVKLLEKEVETLQNLLGQKKENANFDEDKYVKLYSDELKIHQLRIALNEEDILTYRDFLQQRLSILKNETLKEKQLRANFYEELKKLNEQIDSLYSPDTIGADQFNEATKSIEQNLINLENAKIDKEKNDRQLIKETQRLNVESMQSGINRELALVDYQTSTEIMKYKEMLEQKKISQDVFLNYVNAANTQAERQKYEIIRQSVNEARDLYQSYFNDIINMARSSTDSQHNFAKQLTNWLLGLLQQYLTKYISTKIAENSMATTTEIKNTSEVAAGAAARTAAITGAITTQTAASNFAMAELTAASIASMSAISSAAAAAATLVSIATFGGAAAIGSGSVAAALALIQSLVKINGFKEGGYTGDGNPEEVAGTAHKGEYYFQASLVKGNKEKIDLLRKMMESGMTFDQAVMKIARQVNPIIEAPQAVSGLSLVSPTQRAAAKDSEMVNSLLSSIHSELKQIKDKGMKLELQMDVVKTQLKGSDIWKSYKLEDKIQEVKKAG